jgi:hypothetical protein
MFISSSTNMHKLNKFISSSSTPRAEQRSLTMSHGELHHFRDAPLAHQLLLRRQHRSRVQQRLGPRHNLELAVPARILRRRRPPLPHCLAVQQLVPDPPRQRLRSTGGVARCGELGPKSVLVVPEAHHCAGPAATTTAVRCSLGWM